MGDADGIENEIELCKHESGKNAMVELAANPPSGTCAGNPS